MSQKEDRKESVQESQVSRFFAGKSVLVTGAAGFLGVVILEILIRCCPDIKWIYILLRPKKGVQPEERKEAVFKKLIFQKIKEKNPDALNKVLVLPGDISKPNLGMSEEDLARVQEDVTIVFHVAAAINFLKPLRFTLEQNLAGTSHVVDLCKSLKKLDVLVYTSTAYSNCNQTETIQEKVYDMPYSAQTVLDTLRTKKDEDLDVLYNMCEPKFLNFYTYSKCLTENLLKETLDLPVAVVRPSIIGNCWKGPLPGFLEGDSGIMNISVGIGKGFIRVLHIDENKILDYIPVDVVANVHLVAAWLQGTERQCTPIIYNCTSGELAPLTWGDFTQQMFALVQKYPLPNAYQKPSITLCKNSVLYWILSVVEHYIPALVIDALLYVTGRKPKLYNLYRFYDKSMGCVSPFMCREWKFRCENFKALHQKMNSIDSEIFYTDISELTIEELTKSLPTGAPVYQWTNDKKPYKERMRTTYLRYYFITCIKWAIIGAMVSLLWAVVF